MGKIELHKISENSSLTPKQSRAVTCLLSSRTIGEAAKAAHISERTLYTWLANDIAFRSVLRTAQQESLAEATRRLSAGQGKALDALEGLIARAKHENVKRQAALDWLNLFLKFHDLREIDERLSELEKVVFNDSKK